MKTKLTHAIRTELANAVRDRYAAAANKDKRRILEEFIAAIGYHEKSAIRVLNSSAAPKRQQIRQRPSIYDEAVRGALIVLWEASDRVCGKRLKALLPILLPALERNGHLKLEEEIRHKILSMSAATIDRPLQMPRRADRTKKPRVVPEPRRRIKMHVNFEAKLSDVLFAGNGEKGLISRPASGLFYRIAATRRSLTVGQTNQLYRETHPVSSYRIPALAGWDAA